MSTVPKRTFIKNIVWFKKDLRVLDHKPLKLSVEDGPTLAVYVIEEQWLNSKECSDFHKQFLKDSLIELSKSLKKRGVPLLVLIGEVVEVFKKLKYKLDFKTIYAHEETGLLWTYRRDLKVIKWCGENAINFQEFKQFSVLRGLKDRDRWHVKRPKIIERQTIDDFKQNTQISLKIGSDSLLNLSSLETPNTASIQKGGSSKALKTLDSFYSARGERYSKELSSPVTAFNSCSRVSPYISWGNLSLTQIHQSILEQRYKIKSLSFEKEKNWYGSLKSFESRLWWHCHFIQKLESEPEIEFKNMNRAFDGMRENDHNELYFEAWKNGETGYPLIDACMRALIQKGWINFRMRAMLVSFASYQLWIHWRKISHHLAKLFVDFEPGIHFSQLQMQSGVTGINSIRIYSPIKQTLDQDPEGFFIKEYCPELSELDPKFLAEPWKTPPMILQMADVRLGENYPRPIVNHKEAYKKAKDTVFEWRKKASVIEESKAVYLRHGSRKNKNFPTQHRRVF